MIHSLARWTRYTLPQGYMVVDKCVFHQKNTANDKCNILFLHFDQLAEVCIILNNITHNSLGGNFDKNGPFTTKVKSNL